MTKVSFIVVAYKSNDVLLKLLKSLLEQSGDFERELIVVDNFVRESCKGLVSAAFPAAKIVVNETNLGYTRAINQALKVASGDYLFLLNPDVELKPRVTELLIQAIKEGQSAGAAAPRLVDREGRPQQSVRNFPTFMTLVWEHSGLAALFPRNRVMGRWKNRFFAHNTHSVVEQPMASALVIRKDAADAVGLWDEQFFIFFSDVDYCKRLAQAGYQIIFEPQAEAYHTVGGSTHKEGTWLIWDAHRGFYRYLGKHELIGWKKILKAKAWTMLMVSASLRVAYRKLTGKLF